MPQGNLLADVELLAIFAGVAAVLVVLLRQDMKAQRRVNTLLGLGKFGAWSRTQPWPLRAGIGIAMLLALVMLAWRH